MYRFTEVFDTVKFPLWLLDHLIESMPVMWLIGVTWLIKWTKLWIEIRLTSHCQLISIQDEGYLIPLYITDSKSILNQVCSKLITVPVKQFNIEQFIEISDNRTGNTIFSTFKVQVSFWLLNHAAENKWVEIISSIWWKKTCFNLLFDVKNIVV